MGYYKHTELSDVQYIPLANVLISKPIIIAVEKLGGHVPNNILIDYYAPSFGKLERLNSFSNLNKLVLPPVKLSKVENSEYYEIIDGRHRVAISIANNFSKIPSIIV